MKKAPAHAHGAKKPTATTEDKYSRYTCAGRSHSRTFDQDVFTSTLITSGLWLP
jgi:hypothetical protein